MRVKPPQPPRTTPPRAHRAILDELHSHGEYIARKKFLPLKLAYISFLSTWLLSALMYVVLHH